ncbi:Glycosyltransferase involved in cell wall bisynthesis [Parabacteroides chinchillae]|uniref:Glycosyltransferase involved in cell wall bisynthesis n=2 Tax=Parabacteroides chinchillae TaxID=871327 RepID=A0A8G2BX34_9BACT|nr:Glycosyltransferase involved in cell wall bisynthesis [Parabacteroides chinchillae]
MKLLFLNTSERTGGAAVAANRLMHALQSAGIDVKMLVRDKTTDNCSVVSLNDSFVKRKINFFRFVWERLVIFICNHFNRKDLFKVSIANTGTDISKHPLVQEADIIHLHWINQGFLSLKDIRKLIKLGKPIVWTMHDMWPCTGICHHAWGCDKFMLSCGQCKFLDSKSNIDLSYRILKGKGFIIKSDIHIVAVSSWLKNLAKKSALTKRLNISVIPNVIDTAIFYPTVRKDARLLLSIPMQKRVVLMGAARIDDPIKGLDFLREALGVLSNGCRDDILLVLFGGMKGDISFLSSFPVEVLYLGSISDTQKIARLYAAADVTVCPSFYETFGQTITEAMACGCPVVSFDNSGQTDIIDHKHNGYLAKYKDANDLATGIRWVLDNENKEALSLACAKKVQENYTEKVVAEKYLSLYNSLLERK